MYLNVPQRNMVWYRERFKPEIQVAGESATKSLFATFLSIRKKNTKEYNYKESAIFSILLKEIINDSSSIDRIIWVP